MSLLKPDQSIMVAAAVAALVGGLYMNATPTAADVRVGNTGDPDVESARKMAAWTSAAAVGGVALIARDTNIFVLGGAMIIALDWWTRHANEVDPVLKRAVPLQVGTDASAEVYDAQDG